MQLPLSGQVRFFQDYTVAIPTRPECSLEGDLKSRIFFPRALCTQQYPFVPSYCNDSQGLLFVNIIDKYSDFFHASKLPRLVETDQVRFQTQDTPDCISVLTVPVNLSHASPANPSGRMLITAKYELHGRACIPRPQSQQSIANPSARGYKVGIPVNLHRIAAKLCG